MEEIKIDINVAEGRNWLSLTAKLSKEEIDRLTPENRLFLNTDDAGGNWIVNVPFAILGTI